mgnify:CR=1 FL=1
MIKLIGLNKVYGKGSDAVHALRDVSLHVPQGKIFGVIGASGAGKSTLIRCVNLLERPTQGQVIVDGQDLVALEPMTAPTNTLLSGNDLPVVKPGERFTAKFRVAVS